jgi:hypothetical protein
VIGMMTLISMLGHPPRCRIGDDPAVLGAHSPQYGFPVAMYPPEMLHAVGLNAPCLG